MPFPGKYCWNFCGELIVGTLLLPLLPLGGILPAFGAGSILLAGEAMTFFLVGDD